MPSSYDLYSIPDGLPVPDDGACDHLTGVQLPSMALSSTEGTLVDLRSSRARTALYAYPRTGRADEPGSDGWDATPGARGCTPQSCGFRDHHDELPLLGARVYDLSTQSTDYQREAVARLHLPFPLLSDSALTFAGALGLPTFEFEPRGSESSTPLRRLALVIRGGCICKVFYPVFPPGRNAADVIAWLTGHLTSLGGPSAGASPKFQA